ncbi:unnamed protein product [Ectocarpus sp. CCAP 1310/34]|nr:unnamed protein product [Ectocarpus sp. CCAP 1310/34]
MFCQTIYEKSAPLTRCWGFIDGTIRAISRPKRRDCGESGLLQDLQHWLNDAAGTPYYVFGDPAYSLSPWLLAPFKGVLNAFEQAFDTAMSSVRVSVEWGFGKIVALWPYVDYAKKQQVALSACGLGKQYAVAGILTNYHSCFYRNNTSFYFDVNPPSLRSYLNGEG